MFIKIGSILNKIHISEHCMRLSNKLIPIKTQLNIAYGDDNVWRCVFPLLDVKKDRLAFFDELKIHRNVYPTKQNILVIRSGHFKGPSYSKNRF